MTIPELNEWAVRMRNDAEKTDNPFIKKMYLRSKESVQRQIDSFLRRVRCSS